MRTLYIFAMATLHLENLALFVEYLSQGERRSGHLSVKNGPSELRSACEVIFKSNFYKFTECVPAGIKIFMFTIPFSEIEDIKGFVNIFACHKFIMFISNHDNQISCSSQMTYSK